MQPKDRDPFCVLRRGGLSFEWICHSRTEVRG